MNWGKGIAIFMIAFMTFIASMVYYAFTLNADLVMDDYYENERLYDSGKESRFNYASLDEKVLLEKREEGVVFLFPEHSSLPTSGIISFYRPDEKKYDRSFDLQLDAERKQTIEYNHFREGYYDVTVSWQDSSRSYIFEDHIQF